MAKPLTYRKDDVLPPDKSQIQTKKKNENHPKKK